MLTEKIIDRETQSGNKERVAVQREGDVMEEKKSF